MKMICDLLFVLFIYLFFLTIGWMIGVSYAEAAEVERIGIFTQPDGKEVLEVCYTDRQCDQETYSWEEIEEMNRELKE